MLLCQFLTSRPSSAFGNVLANVRLSKATDVSWCVTTADGPLTMTVIHLFSATQEGVRIRSEGLSEEYSGFRYHVQIVGLRRSLGSSSMPLRCR